MPEEFLVQELATIVWRKHRLIFAENIQIAKACGFRAHDSKMIEAWHLDKKRNRRYSKADIRESDARALGRGLYYPVRK